MKKKNAFTLIELLAVIVLLAIVSVLIIPKVSQAIKDSRKSANEISANGLLRTATSYYLETKTGHRRFSGCVYDFSNAATTCRSLNIDGNMPTEGKMTITSDGYIALAVKFGDSPCYLKTFDSDNITVVTNSLAACDETAYIDTLPEGEEDPEPIPPQTPQEPSQPLGPNQEPTQPVNPGEIPDPTTGENIYYARVIADGWGQSAWYDLIPDKTNIDVSSACDASCQAIVNTIEPQKYTLGNYFSSATMSQLPNSADTAAGIYYVMQYAKVNISDMYDNSEVNQGMMLYLPAGYSLPGYTYIIAKSGNSEIILVATQNSGGDLEVDVSPLADNTDYILSVLDYYSYES